LGYLFDPVAGQAIIAEPPLLALLAFFTISTLVGAGLWLTARRLRHRDELAHKYLGRLGTWLFWVSVLGGLFFCWLFYEGVVLRQRFWLYLMLLAVYAVLAYAVYYRYTGYNNQLAAREVERSRRRASTPAPHTLSAGRPTTRRTVRTTRRKARR
jgi:phosphatidylglycerophosphate synthase